MDEAENKPNMSGRELSKKMLQFENDLGMT